MYVHKLTLEQKLLKTKGIIEATSFECLCLYKEHEKDWIQDNGGIVIQVGELDNMPVNISIFWNTVNGAYLLFWEAISQVVDHRMIDKWFGKNLPNIKRVDAMNFSNVFS